MFMRLALAAFLVQIPVLAEAAETHVAVVREYMGLE